MGNAGIWGILRMTLNDQPVHAHYCTIRHTKAKPTKHKLPLPFLKSKIFLKSLFYLTIPDLVSYLHMLSIIIMYMCISHSYSITLTFMLNALSP